MNRSTLYCIACVVFLIGIGGRVLAFTVSVSNYGCVYSGWEESWYPDQDGNWQYWYWSGTATDRLSQFPYGWGTNRTNTLTCQINENSGAAITNSGASVPSASYLWLKGYGPHVCGSFIQYYQFDLDLTWSGMNSYGPWYLCVVSLPSSTTYDGLIVGQCTSYYTKQLRSSGSCHVTGNLNGSGAPVIVLTNVPPGATVPEPSALAVVLCGIGSVVKFARIRRTARNGG